MRALVVALMALAGCEDAPRAVPTAVDASAPVVDLARAAPPLRRWDNMGDQRDNIGDAAVAPPDLTDPPDLTQLPDLTRYVDPGMAGCAGAQRPCRPLLMPCCARMFCVPLAVDLDAGAVTYYECRRLLGEACLVDGECQPGARCVGGHCLQ